MRAQGQVHSASKAMPVLGPHPGLHGGCGTPWVLKAPTPPCPHHQGLEEGHTAWLP